MKTEKFQVTGMTCASCQAHVTKGVQKMSGVQEVNVSLLANQMTVTYDETVVDSDTASYSLTAMQQKLCKKYGRQNGMDIFHSWFDAYTDVDVVDTGEYDCYSEQYVTETQKNADLIQCQLNYVKGSNMLLEKLVSGNWDQQFLIVEPGQTLSVRNFVS